MHWELIIHAPGGLSDEQQADLAAEWHSLTGAVLKINAAIDPDKDYSLGTLIGYYSKPAFASLDDDGLADYEQQLKGTKGWQTFGSWFGTCQLIRRKKRQPEVLLDIVYMHNRAVSPSDTQDDASTDSVDTERALHVERSDSVERCETELFPSEAKETDDGPTGSTSLAPEWDWMNRSTEDSSNTDRPSVFDVQLPAFFNELPADARLAWIQQARDRPF